MKYAILADIHGNRWALEAVLADIRRRDIGTILNLGDLAYGPLDPAGTMKLLDEVERTHRVVTIRGNQDRLFDEQGASLNYTRAQLTDEQIERLVSLPPKRKVDGMLLCHGSPEHDMAYLLERVDQHGVQLRSALDVARLLGEYAQGIVFCGHTHVPRIVQVNANCMVVNPGSVGLQAYTDDVPYQHAMQTGSPHARYTILTRTDEAIRAEQICLEYDWHSAARSAEENRRSDWAFALRTGFAMSHQLREANQADLEGISALLEVNKLARPSGEPISFVVAEARGELIGAAGLEIYGRIGLLRSVVVSQERRGYGLGKQLAEDRLRFAREHGLETLYLLTEKAATYWTRFGFETISRDEAPARIRSSHEFAHACPSSSTLMRLNTGSRNLPRAAGL